MAQPSQSEQARLNSNRIGKNFSVELYVGDQEITKYLYGVRIVNNILCAWPTISIRLGIDCNNIILNDIYGQTEMKLKITLNTEEGKPQETNVFHLLYLESNVGLIPKVRESQNQYDLQTIEFSTIPIYAMNLMGMFINEIYEEEDGPKTGIQIIQDILTGYGFPNEIDNKGAVTTTINQTIIPPMSFNQMINFLELYNGIYQGPIFYNCSHTGKFRMWDMSQRIQKTSIFKIYQLSTGGSDPDDINKIFKETTIGNAYYTREPVQTIYHSNANVLKYGYDFFQVMHTSSSLYDLKYKSADDIVKNFGVVNEGKNFVYNNFLKNRRKYFYNISGNHELVTCTASSNLARLSTLQITLNRNIRISKILNIGEPITFEPKTLEYMRYQGKYILESYDFQLSQTGADNWDSICQLRMFRTIQQQ